MTLPFGTWSHVRVFCYVLPDPALRLGHIMSSGPCVINVSERFSSVLCFFFSSYVWMNSLTDGVILLPQRTKPHEWHSGTEMKNIWIFYFCISFSGRSKRATKEVKYRLSTLFNVLRSEQHQIRPYLKPYIWNSEKIKWRRKTSK